MTVPVGYSLLAKLSGSVRRVIARDLIAEAFADNRRGAERGEPWAVYLPSNGSRGNLRGDFLQQGFQVEQAGILQPRLAGIQDKRPPRLSGWPGPLRSRNDVPGESGECKIASAIRNCRLATRCDEVIG